MSDIPEKAVNYYQTRVHYSLNLDQRPPFHGPGRRGTALCTTETNPVEVYDAEARTWDAERYGAPVKPFKSLPLCMKCEKKLAKIGGGS